MTAPAHPAGPLRLAVVDDQAILVAAFTALLDAQADMEVVTSAADGRAALEALRTAASAGTPADVTLMDIRMPVLDGVAATRAILADPALAGTRVLVLTTFDDEALVMAALRAGASGFLLKDAEPATLLAAVRAVGAGQAWLDPVVTPVVLSRLEPEAPAPPAAAPSSLSVARPGSGLLPGSDPLTERERDVLALVCQGLPNAEVAQHLHVAESTVKSHVKAVLGKTGCRNRVELVVHAFTSGLVGPSV